jgi:hypothetical protein
MRPLVIEYVLAGHQRGYNFTTDTSGFSDDDLKFIWRSAMPRGQGWSAYVGSRSLKCFPLAHDLRVAVCQTEVTDLQDEHGRSGIRRTVIDVMSRGDYLAYLDQRLLNLPPLARARVDRLPTFRQRLAISNRVNTRRKNQLALLATYHDAERWQVIEGLLIKLALAPVGPLRHWGAIIPFTTLALSAHDEAALVALPTSKASSIDKQTPVLHLD